MSGSRPASWLAGPYAIVDVGARLTTADAPAVLDALLGAGIVTVQLRAKGLDAGPLLALARRLRAQAHAAGATFVLNDRPDVAALAGADGVHLGQHDLSVADVRRWLPPGMIVGVSCHDLAQVERACGAGADYLGYGPVFATTSKADPDPVVGLDGLAAACMRAGAIPVVGIGGIGVDHLPAIRAAGARGAAMIGALGGAPDPAVAARAALEAWSRGAR